MFRRHPLKKKSLMTGCRNSTLLLILCLLCAFPAQGKPLPAATGEDAGVYTVPSVRIAPLEKLKTDAYGLRVPEDGAPLDGSMWENSSLADVRQKITETQTAFFPPAAEELRRMLLLTAAEPPRGTAEGEFLTLRLSDLFRRGDFESLRELTRKIPDARLTDEQAELFADASLLLSDNASACRQTVFGRESLYFQKLAVLCAALDKDENKTQLGLDLLAEQGNADPFLHDAAEALLSNRPLTEKPAELTPSSFFLMRLFGTAPSDEQLRTDEIWRLAAFAESSNVPWVARIESAEKLVRHGLLAPRRLEVLYEQAVLPEAPPAEGPLYRALMYRNATAAFTGDARGENIRKALASARQDGNFIAAARAFRELLASLEPDSDTATVSADIVQALALNGQTENLQRWMEAAREKSPESRTQAEAWHVEDLSRPDSVRPHIPEIEKMMAFEEKGFPDAENEKQSASAEKLVRKTDRIMLLLETLGLFAPDETWVYTSFAENGPETTFLKSLHEKGKDGKKVLVSAGEQILDILKELQKGYVGILNAARRLSDMGLGDQGRLLALEALSPDILAPE